MKSKQTRWRGQKYNNARKQFKIEGSENLQQVFSKEFPVVARRETEVNTREEDRVYQGVYQGFKENTAVNAVKGETDASTLGSKRTFAFNPHAMEFQPSLALQRSSGISTSPPPVQVAQEEAIPRIITALPSGSIFVPDTSLQPILCIPFQPYSPAAVLSPVAQNPEYSLDATNTRHQWGQSHQKDYVINHQLMENSWPSNQYTTGAGETIFIPVAVNKSSHQGSYPPMAVFLQGSGTPTVGTEGTYSSEMHPPTVQLVTLQNGAYLTAPPNYNGTSVNLESNRAMMAPNTAGSPGNWNGYGPTNGTKYYHQVHHHPNYSQITGGPVGSEFPSNVQPAVIPVPLIQNQENWNPSSSSHHRLETTQIPWIAPAQMHTPWLYQENGRY